MKYLSMVFGMLSCGYRSLIKHWDSQVHTDYMYSFLHPISHRGSARMSFLNVGTTFNQSKPEHCTCKLHRFRKFKEFLQEKINGSGRFSSCKTGTYKDKNNNDDGVQ
eukprot:XP_019926492.1 PREDICTED: uncharacterized protein LOC109619842 isoform X1 [Crassostrea gigas]